MNPGKKTEETCWAHRQNAKLLPEEQQAMGTSRERRV